MLPRKRIAVIGSGVAGLGCSWLLSSSLKDQVQVTLYEKGSYLGGHTNTVDIHEKKVVVDTGFIVYNERNYPNLVSLLKHLSVETVPSDMSFALSVQQYSGKDELEWSSDGLSTVFAQTKNIFSPSFWRMLWEIVRFGSETPLILNNPKYEQVTVGQYLHENGYSEGFINNYIVPITAAIWSTPAGKMLQFPLKTMIHFMHNHQMLQIFNRPIWRTVKNGSREYVKKMQQVFLQNKNVETRLNSPVKSVRREQTAEGKTQIAVTSNNSVEYYDSVVFACHADEALAMLGDPTSEERAFLSCFDYTPNRAYLHCDKQLMPKRRKVWASWNYLHFRGDNQQEEKLVLSYWMNRLQTFIPKDVDLIVTLNPFKEPAKEKTFAVIDYEHPVYLPKSITAQRLLKENQGTKNTYFCGAYCGFGFHEDALMSGLQVAEQLGAKCPWKIDTSRYEMAPVEQASFVLLRVFLVSVLIAILAWTLSSLLG